MARWVWVLLWALALPTARALALPAPVYSVQLEGSELATGPGTYTVLGDVGTIAITPSPSVHVHVNGTGTSFVSTQYFFRVDGPADGLTVPVTISGLVAIDAGGAVFAQNLIWGVTAQLIAQSFDGQFGGPPLQQVDYQFATVDCDPQSEGPIAMPPPIASCGATHQVKNVVLNLTAQTGADNRIVVNAAANNRETFAANFDSLVDPVIAFAPGFDPTGYTIVLSEGVGNAVPEPTSEALAAAALSLLTLARRRFSARCANGR